MGYVVDRKRLEKKKQLQNSFWKITLEAAKSTGLFGTKKWPSACRLMDVVLTKDNGKANGCD